MEVNGNLPYPKIRRSTDWLRNMLIAILIWLIRIDKVLPGSRTLSMIFLNPYFEIARIATIQKRKRRIKEKMLFFFFFEKKNIG